MLRRRGGGSCRRFPIDRRNLESSQTHDRRSALPLLIAAIAWGGGLAWALALDDPRRRFPQLAVALLVSTAGAIVASRAELRLVRVLVCAALCARLWALALSPALSEDLFRYVYEGRVALAYGPWFAFQHPPAAGPALGVDAALLDAAWLRVNHASIPTLYPPLAQATFAAGAWLGDAAGMLLGDAGRALHAHAIKLLLVLAELAAVWTLRRVDRRAALLALLCPLAIVEIAREGHGDALAVLGVAIGAGALSGHRRAPDARRAALGFALAALGKLVGAVPLLAALRLDPRRAAWPALVVLALAAIPYTLASTTGLSTYGSAWQSGDGVFSLLVWLARAILGGDWLHVGEPLDTITAHELARALTALGFSASAALVLWGRGPFGARGDRADLDRAGLLVLLLLLWSPTVHPWYVLWLLPFAALGSRGSPAMWLLIALAPLLHHPGWLALERGVWTDVPALRALVHASVWALLAVSLVRRPRVV